MKFIKLTEALGNDETRVAMINFEYVQCFGNGTKGKDTHVRLHDKSFFFVKESVEDIANMINIDYARQPIMMTGEEYANYKKNRASE